MAPSTSMDSLRHSFLTLSTIYNKRRKRQEIIWEIIRHGAELPNTGKALGSEIFGRDPLQPFLSVGFCLHHLSSLPLSLHHCRCPPLPLSMLHAVNIRRAEGWCAHGQIRLLNLLTSTAMTASSTALSIQPSHGLQWAHIWLKERQWGFFLSLLTKMFSDASKKFAHSLSDHYVMWLSLLPMSKWMENWF